MLQAQAEQAAWDYVKKHNIDLVVVNPSFVFGPTISKRIDGESSKAMVVCDQQSTEARCVLSCRLTKAVDIPELAITRSSKNYHSLRLLHDADCARALFIPFVRSPLVRFLAAHGGASLQT